MFLLPDACPPAPVPPFPHGTHPSGEKFRLWRRAGERRQRPTPGEPDDPTRGGARTGGNPGASLGKAEGAASGTSCDTAPLPTSDRAGSWRTCTKRDPGAGGGCVGNAPFMLGGGSVGVTGWSPGRLHHHPLGLTSMTPWMHPSRNHCHDHQPPACPCHRLPPSQRHSWHATSPARHCHSLAWQHRSCTLASPILRATHGCPLSALSVAG